MPVGKHIDPKIKATIIKKIRDDSLSVSEARTQYGVRPKTIYGWQVHFAGALGVDRSNHYRPATKQQERDEKAIAELEAVHAEHPFYGVRRFKKSEPFSQF